MSSSNIIDAYDTIAPLYAEYSLQRQKYLDAVDKLIAHNLDDGTRLLDIGSGDGRRLTKLQQLKNFDEIVAVEPSTKMAEICADKTGLTVHNVFGEQIDKLNIGTFDAATAMWNILGHISSPQGRLNTLKNIGEKLSPEGKLLLDVNNRHNASAYGVWTVMYRTIVDKVNFRESRGDARYQWVIGNQTFDANGHLFIPTEIESLFSQAGFRVQQRLSVNYATGESSISPYKGQLFYVLVKA